MRLIHKSYYGNSSKDVFIFQKITIQDELMVTLIVADRGGAETDRNKDGMMI